MNIYFVIVLLFPIYSCISFNSTEGDNINSQNLNIPKINQVPKITWGDHHQEVIKYQNYYFSGQPNKTTILYSKANNISLIIDLRSDTQQSAITKEKAAIYKILYNDQPTTLNDMNSENKYLDFYEIINKHEEEKILIIQDKSNISACWFSMYKSDKSNLNTDAAERMLEIIGLTDKNIQSKCLKIIENR